MRGAPCRRGSTQGLEQLLVEGEHGHEVASEADAQMLHGVGQGLAVIQGDRRRPRDARLFAGTRASRAQGDQPGGRCFAVVVQAAPHLHDVLTRQGRTVPPEHDGDGRAHGAATQRPGQMEFSGSGARATHRSERDHAFGVEPGREQLEGAGRGQSLHLPEQGAAHGHALASGHAQHIRLRAAGVLGHAPVGQREHGAVQAEARSTTVDRAAGRVAPHRGREGRSQRGRAARHATASHELTRHIRQRGRPMVAAPSEHSVDGVRQLEAREVSVLGGAIPIAFEFGAHRRGLFEVALGASTLAATASTVTSTVGAPSLAAAAFAATAFAAATFGPCALGASVLGLARLATLATTTTLAASWLVLVTLLQAVIVFSYRREDGHVVIVFLGEDLGTGELPRLHRLTASARLREIAVGLVVAHGLRLRRLAASAFGQLEVMSAVRLSRLQGGLVELAQPEHTGLDFDDRGLSAILSHHGGETRAHRDLRRLADVGEQILLNRDLRNLLVVQWFTREAEHLDRGFCERHGRNPHTYDRRGGGTTRRREGFLRRRARNPKPHPVAVGDGTRSSGRSALGRQIARSSLKSGLEPATVDIQQQAGSLGPR